MGWVLELLKDIVVAGVILIAAIWASGFISRKLREFSKEHEELDETLFSFLASLVRYSILIIAGVFVLSQFGVQTTSLVAIIGAAGLAIGLALQGTLSNLAAGVMLLGFRPFKVGDYVSAAGEEGTVASIHLFTVELVTVDNIQITVPNSDIWASSIKNYSYFDTRRIDLTFGVSYDTDLKKAETALRDVIKKDKRTLSDPEPWVKVVNLGDSSVDFQIRVWSKRSDYWDFKCDLQRAVKEAFDKAGVDIPFPTAISLEKRI